MSSFVELRGALQVTRSAAEDLEQSMGEVFGPLRDCMDHEGVEVRKVVVRHTYIPFIHALSQKLVASAALGSRRGCGCGTCASLRLLCSAFGTAVRRRFRNRLRSLRRPVGWFAPSLYCIYLAGTVLREHVPRTRQ